MDINEKIDREIDAALAGKQTALSVACWGEVPAPKPREKHALIPGPDDPRDMDIFTASRRFNYIVKP